MTDTKRPHHHGNLREALIVAGLELMEADGPDALSLRKCAGLAGVSHAAPAHHFNGLISLKAAIVARGHRLISASMRRASDRAAPAPHAQLNAICEGYILFARQHSGVFKFMFQPHNVDMDTLDAETRADLERETAISYQILRDACAPFEHRETGNIGTEIMIWSLVHGYAMLFGDTHGNPSPHMAIPDFSQIIPKLRQNPETRGTPDKPK